MPRKIIIEKTVFKFEELSDKAKEKARAWFRDGNDDTHWADVVYEDAATLGAYMGIDLRTRTEKARNGEPMCGLVNIYYSGFWSQGDGACFEGNWHAKAIDVAGLKQAAPQDTKLHVIADGLAAVAKDYPEARATTKHSGHYYHSGCMAVDWNVGTHPTEDDPPHSWYDDFDSDSLTDLLRSFADWIYRQLEEAYEQENSNEQVDENIICNEYEFYEDGSRALV